MTTMTLPQRPYAAHQWVRLLGPNWFTCVMGTGIVANAAITLPLRLPGQKAAATGVWLLAAALLVTLSTIGIMNRDRIRAHALDPAMAPFFGAPPMAMLTVGAGTLLVGRDILGLPLALTIDAVLWTAGTLSGLVSTVAIPYIMVIRQGRTLDMASPTWLMPVVPPMVSAATGALLVPYLPPGLPRETLLIGCTAMFALSLLTSALIISLVWRRLTEIKAGPAQLVPTLWIVLGPLGQSITAVCLLSKAAPESYNAFAMIYSVPVGAFALFWLCLATAITVCTVRKGMPFALTWWAFTFPVGTCVTGLSGLASRTGSAPLQWAAATLYALLVLAWITVGVRTVRAIAGGELAGIARPVTLGS
jgi:C4-dicarboxylate transporter/malic acid transport protein